MSHLLLLPLADGFPVVGVIMLVIVVFSVVSNISKASKEKIKKTGKRTALDERISQRLAQRRAKASRNRNEEAALQAASAMPPELADMILTPQDRAAIAAAQRAREAEAKERQDQQRRRPPQQVAARPQPVAQRPQSQLVRQKQATVARLAPTQQKIAKPAIMAAVTSGVRSAHRRDSGVSRGDRMRHLLRKRDSFKTIIIASEVLGKPVGLRDDQ